MNRDRASGKIIGLSDGKLGLDLGKRQLNVPLERVTQINFASGARSKAIPREIRVHLF